MLFRSITSYLICTTWYEVITESHKSTLRLFNNPVDGCYYIPIGMVALDKDTGKEFTSSYSSWKFTGETCDFDTAQFQEYLKCLGKELTKMRDESREQLKFRKPKPGEPIIKFSEEIWHYVTKERRDTVDSLLDIMTNTFRDNPETYTWATNQLEKEIGLQGGISRFIQFTNQL